MQATLAANGEMRAQTLTATRVLTTVYLPSTSTEPCTPSTLPGLGLYALGADQPWTQFPTFTERNARAPDAPQAPLDFGERLCPSVRRLHGVTRPVRLS